MALNPGQDLCYLLRCVSLCSQPQQEQVGGGQGLLGNEPDFLPRAFLNRKGVVLEERHLNPMAGQPAPSHPAGDSGQVGRQAALTPEGPQRTAIVGQQRGQRLLDDVVQVLCAQATLCGEEGRYQTGQPFSQRDPGNGGSTPALQQEFLVIHSESVAPASAATLRMRALSAVRSGFCRNMPKCPDRLTHSPPTGALARLAEARYWYSQGTLVRPSRPP